MADTNALDRQLDAVDAAVFSGELLWIDDQRNLLKQYAERWLRAIHEHEHMPDRVDVGASPSDKPVAWMHEFTDPFTSERRCEPRRNRPSDFELQPGDTVRPLIYAPGVAVGAPAQYYVTCHQCDNCQHIGINDEHPTESACNRGLCGWHGPSPSEDVCPGCGARGTMSTACPECGGHYMLLAEARLPAGVLGTLKTPDGDQQ